MLNDSQVITVDSADRTYAVTDYPDSGAVRRCSLSDGDSTLTISHETQSGVGRHLVKIQDDRILDGAGKSFRIHTVISCEDEATSRVETAKLAEGHLNYLLTSGLLGRILLGES